MSDLRQQALDRIQVSMTDERASTTLDDFLVWLRENADAIAEAIWPDDVVVTKADAIRFLAQSLEAEQ